MRLAGFYGPFVITPAALALISGSLSADHLSSFRTRQPAPYLPIGVPVRVHWRGPRRWRGITKSRTKRAFPSLPGGVPCGGRLAYRSTALPPIPTHIL